MNKAPERETITYFDEETGAVGIGCKLDQSETPTELAEQIADWCGIYGDDNEPERRQNFTVEVTGRIRKSVENERLLAGGRSDDA